MTFANIQVTHADGISTITLNRPKQLNALNADTIGELMTAFGGMADDRGVRAVILTGSGERAFAAGADIGELSQLTSAADARAMAMRTHRLGRVMAELPAPIIAAINGFALGGGLELALACDLRIAADSALLGLPEVTLGILPGWGGTQRLARLAGPGAAKLLMLTGDRIPASEALRLGIVERVVPAAELMAAVQTLAQQIAALPPLSVAAIKQAVNQGLQMTLDQGNAYEAGLFGELALTADAKEGTRAFVEKRTPTWQGK